jgi:hypothetical protein
MMMKSGLEFFILKFTEPLQKYLPGQFSLSGQMFLHWAVATLKGLGEISKNSRPLFTIIFKSKMSISRLEILVLILKKF